MNPVDCYRIRTILGVSLLVVLLALWSKAELLSFASPMELSLIVGCLLFPTIPVVVALKRATHAFESSLDL